MTSEKVKTLCGLPDDILSHILSFLPTQDAIKTSILSTRWKYVFMSVPVIDLDDEMLAPDEMFGFITSVSRLLCQRKISSKLFKFVVTYKESKQASVISDWIRNALDCDVQELEIGCSSARRAPDCVFAPDSVLASEIFLSRTLVVLKLYSVVVNISKLVSLPNLKTLTLEFVEFFGDDASLKRLFVGFGSLEYLMMSCCWMNIARGVLNLSLTSLRHLYLYNPYCYRLIIDTPKLEYLRIYLGDSNYSTNVVLVKDLQYLVQADLCSGIRAAKSSGLAALFNAMHNVKALTLYTSFFRGNIIQPSTFSNLTCMDLTLHKWEPLLVVLHAAPYLQSLVIHLLCRTREFEFEMQEDIPICLTRSLSTIDIQFWHFEETVFGMVGYLLRHGEVLESVQFDFYLEDVPESRWERLLMLPRCSKTCKLLHL